MKANGRKLHEYLEMTFDFTKIAKIKIKMDNYVEIMINEFQTKISKSGMALTPSRSNIFDK